MLSIDNETLAVGTVASGAAATNVLYQHRQGIKNHILKPVWNAMGKPFSADTYTKTVDAGRKVKDNFKENGLGDTVHKVGHKLKTTVVDKTSSTWSGVKKAWNSFAHNTNWGKVAKVAGWAGIAAAGAFVAKSIWDMFDQY